MSELNTSEENLILERAMEFLLADLYYFYELFSSAFEDKSRWPRDMMSSPFFDESKLIGGETRGQIFAYVDQVMSGQILSAPTTKLHTNEAASRLAIFTAASSCFLRAIKFKTLGSSAKAWEALADGRHFTGLLRGRCSIESKATVSSQANSSRHEPTNNAKSYVLSCWGREAIDYDFNKTAFAKTYVKLVADNFSRKNGDPMVLAERTIVDWITAGQKVLQ